MHVTLDIGDDLISTLLKRTGAKDLDEIIKEGLGWIDWITEEASKGRAIISCDEQANQPKRMITPLFQKTLRKYHPNSEFLKEDRPW